MSDQTPEMPTPGEVPPPGQMPPPGAVPTPGPVPPGGSVPPPPSSPSAPMGQFGAPAFPGAAYPPPGTPHANSGMVTIPNLGTVPVATIGQRFAARLIDLVIIWIIAGILNVVLFAGMFATTRVCTVDPNTGVLSSGCGQAAGLGIASFFGIFFAYAIFAVLYEVGFTATRGATPGKMIMKLKIVLQENGQVPGWGPAAIRWVIPFVGSFVCGIGQLVVYLSMMFDNSGRNQGWHDKAAHDLVISVK